MIEAGGRKPSFFWLLDECAPTFFYLFQLYTPVTNRADCLISKQIFVLGWGIKICTGVGFSDTIV